MWVPQNLPRGRSRTIPPGWITLAPTIYPSLPGSTPPPLLLCDVYSAPRIYPSLLEYTPLFNKYMRPSQNIPLPPRIYPPFQQLYATLPESAPPSQNIFQFWEQGVDSLIITKAPRKGVIFSDWGVYSWNIAYNCREVRRDIFWDGRGHIVV